MPYAGGDEQDIIDRLRSAGALTVSLVATRDSEVIGHVAFSPARASDKSQLWFTLGPVSVLPAHQDQGIGSALIRAGLKRINELGALGCILVGNPEYYRRFGFELAPENAPQEDYKNFFMIKRFSSLQPSDAIYFHEAFFETA